MRHHLKSLCVECQGTTAVEFAIIAPVFIVLHFGTLALAVALFLIGSMHFAVEDGARCASIKTQCPDRVSTIAYTQSHYMGPASPAFDLNYYPAPTGCGYSVTGTINYSLNVGFTTFVIPISATACYYASP